MEMHQVRYFLAVCQTLNFTRAAERCNVSVPALSRAVRALEAELGGDLFRRERHLTHLTDLGRLMQQHLSTAYEATETAREKAAQYAKLDEAKLKLGVVSTMPSGPLVGYLRALRAASPDLELQVWEANCEELGRALSEGEIDVAIMTSPDYVDRLRPQPLFREYYRIAFPPGHRFERMETVPLAELDGEDYVKRLHCEFPSNFAKLEVSLPYKSVRVRFMTEREDWVQSMVMAGLGITIMPEFLPILPGIESRPIVEPEVWRTISMVTVAGRYHSAPVASALRVARAHPWSGAGTDPTPERRLA